jgi:hypothetical protein
LVQLTTVPFMISYITFDYHSPDYMHTLKLSAC